MWVLFKVLLWHLGWLSTAIMCDQINWQIGKVIKSTHLCYSQNWKLSYTWMPYTTYTRMAIPRVLTLWFVGKKKIWIVRKWTLKVQFAWYSCVVLPTKCKKLDKMLLNYFFKNILYIINALLCCHVKLYPLCWQRRHNSSQLEESGQLEPERCQIWKIVGNQMIYFLTVWSNRWIIYLLDSWKYF